MNGLRVVSSIDPDKINCADLKNNLLQLAFILYPLDQFNEKFIIKMRTCVMKLDSAHPVRRWLDSIAKSIAPTQVEQDAEAFLSGIISSQYNLITDAGVKNKIIEIINGIKEKTIAEKILKSFLYLIIGNVTRSDNLMMKIVKIPPLEVWKLYHSKPSTYHKISTAHIAEILQKISKHPSDRKAFQLLMCYLKFYFNDTELVKAASSYDVSHLYSKMELKFVERTAHDFIQFLRLEKLSEENRIKRLSEPNRYTIPHRAFWLDPFLDGVPVKEQSELLSIASENFIWSIYLADNKYVKSKKNLLLDQLNSSENFMLALFKLITIDEVSNDLVSKTVKFFSYD